MHIIFTGLGFIIIPIAFIICKLTAILSNSITGTHHFYSHNIFVQTLSFIIVAITCFYLGRYLNNKQPENKSKLKITYYEGAKHTLFLLDVEIWSIGIFLFSITNMIRELIFGLLK